MRWLISVVATFLALASGLGARASDVATFPRWLPSEVRPSDASIETVFAALRSADASAGRPQAPRTDRYSFVGIGAAVEATARISGFAYAITTTPDGAQPDLGRVNGERWRRTATGTVRLLRADVQGDDFDRWPVTVLGFDEADCIVAGEAASPSASWVLEDRPAQDIPRWLFVDKATGTIVREISREGSRVTVYDFSDERGEPGTRRPWTWTIDRNQVRVTVERHEASADGAPLAVPTQGPPPFVSPQTTTRLDAKFNDTYDAVNIDLRVNGSRRTVQLDDGTTQILTNDAMSAAAGGSLFGHGIADIDASGVRAPRVSFEQIALGIDGLLGYEFFLGHVVHVDFAHRIVEIIPHAAFAPPATATKIDTDWSEGLPLITASVDGIEGTRFALDLGSPDVLLLQDILDRLPPYPTRYVRGGRAVSRFIEGPVSIRTAQVHEIDFAHTRMSDPIVSIEQPDAENARFPLDGIIGTLALGRAEWWFDADGGATWMRPQ